jgi:hypothetical protein
MCSFKANNASLSDLDSPPKDLFEEVADRNLTVGEDQSGPVGGATTLTVESSSLISSTSIATACILTTEEEQELFELPEHLKGIKAQTERPL